MTSYTKTGLLLLIIGVILGIIANITFFFVSDITLLFSAIGGIGGLIILIGIILMILGRKEFGGKHRKFVIYALILFILSIVLPVIVIAGFVATAIISKDLSSIGTVFYITPLAAVLGGLAYIFLLYELENETGKIILLLTIILTIIISVFVAINILPIYEETIGAVDFQDMSTQEITEMVNTFSSKISRISAYNVFHNLLLLIVLLIPYRRITSGELIPTSKK